MNQKSHLKGVRTVQAFCKYVLAKDPDILISSDQHSRSNTILDYLFMKMNKLGLDLQLVRVMGPIKANKIEVRTNLSNKPFQGDLGLAGLIESLIEITYI